MREGNEIDEDRRVNMGTEIEMVVKTTFARFIEMGLKVRRLISLWNDDSFRPYIILKAGAGGKEGFGFIIHIEFQGP